MNLLGAKTNRRMVPVKLGKIQVNPGLVLGVIIMTALLAFEMFNYSTTEYALRDLLGGLSFAGMKWATILAVAFCGIDFAGIARLFTPEQGGEEPKEVWYLFGAWLLAATMNAMLTWWGVSMAIVNHSVQSTAVVSAGTLTKIVPVFVSVMVWVIRILIIGSLSVAGDRMVWGQQRQGAGVGASAASGASAGGMRAGYGTPGMRPAAGSMNAAGVRSAGMASKPLGRAGRVDPLEGRPEPTYHSLGAETEHPSRNTSSIFK